VIKACTCEPRTELRSLSGRRTPGWQRLRREQRGARWKRRAASLPLRAPSPPQAHLDHRV